MIDFKKLVVKYLEEATEKVKTDTCELTESEAMSILSVIAHEPLSKEKSRRFMGNMSRSKFDDLVRERKIPRGRKDSGFKELRWYKDELEAAAYRMNKKKK